MVRRSVAAAAAVFVLSSGAILSGSGPSFGEELAGSVTVTLLAKDGVPLSDALVGIYLHPFGHRPTYRPILVASGTTGADGDFTFSVSDNVQVARQAAKSEDGGVNLEVRALDVDQGWLVDHNLVLSNNGPRALNITAAVDIGDLDLAGVTTSGFLEPRQARPCCDGLEKAGTKLKPVKVAAMHLSRGMKGKFVFKQGRETNTEIAVNWDDGYGWQVGGWYRENEERGFASKTPLLRGPYHRVQRPVYEYQKYRYCGLYDDTNGECLVVRRYFEVEVWTGHIDRRLETSTRGEYDKDHAIPLKPGEVRTTKHQSNHMFGIGLILKGIGLRSHTGYSTITRLRWVGLDTCGKNRLWGIGKWPPQAPTVFAKSWDCD